MHDEIIRQEDQDSTPPIRLGGLNYAWIVAATGSIAMFCGLGLGRFAFGMLLPSMSASLGLNYTQSGILGFTNLIGYLVRCLYAWHGFYHKLSPTLRTLRIDWHR